MAIFAPADGEYILGIEDTRGAAGPDDVYRVEIEPVRDDIYTHITSPDAYQMPRLTGIIVPQGGRWTSTSRSPKASATTIKASSNWRRRACRRASP